MQHNEVSILSTRPLSPELISLAEESGFVMHVVPFIRTEHLLSVQVKDSIDKLSRQSITAAFTSMNAADAVISHLNGIKPRWKLFSIGNTTLKTLAAYFGEQAIVATGNSAGNLADIMVQKLETSNVVFFCGDQRRDDLPAILSRNHITVEEVVVYRTVALNNKIHHQYHGILFFSPSAVNSFFAENSIAGDVTVFAIGETTAETVRSFCDNEIIVSQEPGKEELVRKMFEYYRTQAGKAIR